MKACCVGAGVIGAGWAARFLLNGWDVAVFDPDPTAERKVRQMLAKARHSLPSLYDRMLPSEGELGFHSDLAAAVSKAAWVQESVPEHPDLKNKLHGNILQHMKADAILGASTSHFKTSELQQAVDKPEQIITAQAFDPVYLLPLVEVAPSAKTSKTVQTRAQEILTSIGMRPLLVGKAGVAPIADRLLQALWGEADWLMGEGTNDQADAHPAHMSGTVREGLRDDNLVAMLRGLKKSGSGVGGTINEHEASMPLPVAEGLPVTVYRKVPQTWTDYNGHMNETHYLEAASQATDQFMVMIGADAGYIASGNSYFTVESHIRYLDEVKEGDALMIKTQVLAGEGKKMHLYHFLQNAGGTNVCGVETLLLHVDLNSRKTSLPTKAVALRLARYAKAHASLPVPQGVGKPVG